MSGFAGAQPIILPKLGGLYTFLKPIDIPSGYSPALQNCRFLPRSVLTRLGLTARVAGASFTSGAQFINNSSIKQTLLLDNNGNLYRVSGTGALVPLQNPPAVANPGSRMKVQQSFGREFMSYFTGPPNVTEPLAPGGPIRHWDGNVDAAPGIPAAPIAADSATAGSIAAGVHFAVVFFEMVYGTLSQKGVVAQWTAVGGKKALISNIPLGPTGCVARRIAITSSLDATTFWSLPSFRIHDNVTTSLTIDGSDSTLTAQGYPLAYTNSVLAVSSSAPALAPLSPDGPGVAPVVADDTTVYSAINIQISPTGATELGTVATYQTTAPHGLLVGQTVIVSGVGVSGYNVTAAIASVPTPSSFTLTLGVSGLAASGGGTVTLSGAISIGVHQVQVVWETRWGFLTAPSPTVQWTAAGGLGALVTNIPIGPWYVVARRILVTLSGGADFFYISQNRIGDNTSTSFRIDFTDVILAAGSNFDYLARNFGPMDSYGVGVYGGRLVTWGGLNTLKGLNLGFDGGWNFADGTPAGWQQGAFFSAAAAREIVNVFCGEALRITGNHGNLPVGQIYNSSIQPLLLPNTSYTVSFRAATDGGGVNGSLVVDLWSPTVGLLSPSVSNNGALTTVYKEFQGVILNGLAAIPSDTVLRVYAQDGGSVSGNFYIDHIRIWPTQQKYEASVVRFSNPFDPETFDGVDGFIQISKDDGQQVTACQQLRSFFYILKERSWSTTYDDGTNPPSLWFTRSVDKTIGVGSPNGLVSSDTYLVAFWRSGAYMYAGGKPTKVSQEIQPTWQSFNWQEAWQTHILLDTQGKQILFFGPMNGATQPQNSLLLDYSEGIGQEDDPAGRKWGLDAWPVPINMSFLFENANNTQAIYLVGPKLYENTGTDDDGTPIDSFYEIAYVKAGDHGQDQFLGCSYFAEGSGKILTTFYSVDAVIAELSTKDIELTSNPGKQFEIYANLETERAKLRFEMLQDGANFVIKGVTMYAMPNFYEQRPA